MNPSYLKKWMKDKSFTALCESLNKEEWIEILSEYGNQDYENLLQIFEASKMIDVKDIFLIELSEVNPLSKSMICEVSNMLIADGILNHKKEFIDELLELSRYLEINISTDKLKNIITNQKNCDNTRVNAALLFNDRKDQQDFWDSVNFKENTFLLPYYMMFYERINPIKSLSALKIFSSKPENIQDFEWTVRNSLLTLINYPNQFNIFWSEEKSLPQWIFKYIEESVLKYEELHYLHELITVGNNRTIRTEKKILPDLRIGLSVFPDIMILELLLQIESFRDFELKIETIYKPWNKLFKELDLGKVDVITTNQEMLFYNEKRSISTASNDVSSKYKVLDFVNKYDGFSIISKSNLTSYKEFESEIKESIDGKYSHKALRNTLSQIRKRDRDSPKIIVSKGTDHHYSLNRLIKESGFNTKDFNIFKSDKEPFDVFLSFLNGNADIFVGAAPHSQILSSQKGFKELLTEKDSDFGLIMYNMLITTRSNYEDKKKMFDRFVTAYKHGMEDLLSSYTNYTEDLHQLYIRKLKDEYGDTYSSFQISLNEFKTLVSEIIDFQDNIEFAKEENESYLKIKKSIV